MGEGNLADAVSVTRLPNKGAPEHCKNTKASIAPYRRAAKTVAARLEQAFKV